MKDLRRNAANFDVPLPYQTHCRKNDSSLSLKWSYAFPAWAVRFWPHATTLQLLLDLCWKYDSSWWSVSHHMRGIMSNYWSFVQIFINERQKRGIKGYVQYFSTLFSHVFLSMWLVETVFGTGPVLSESKQAAMKCYPWKTWANWLGFLQ